VQQRHDAIQQIERTMIELQQLFQDLDAIVVEQEAAIINIEQKAEETHTHLEAGNVHVDKAIVSARGARKKKWICLGICGKYCWLRELPNHPLIVLTLGQFLLFSSSSSSLSSTARLRAGSRARTTIPRPQTRRTVNRRLLKGPNWRWRQQLGVAPSSLTGYFLVSCLFLICIITATALIGIWNERVKKAGLHDPQAALGTAHHI
jgi:hypothetical protein